MSSDAKAENKGVVRVLTAIAGIPVILAAAYFGGLWFSALILAIGLLAQLEVASLFGRADARPFLPVALVLGTLLVARHWLPHWEVAAMIVSVGTILALPFIPGDRMALRVASTFFVVVYPVWLISFLADVRLGVGISAPDDQLMRLTVLVFVLIWTSDTISYYAGSAVGKTPFFPSVSPKKTWEGFLGGVAGTTVVCILAKTLTLVDLSWLDVAAFVLICGVGGPLGDLVESRLKRSVEMKDSGSILPGHGGMLDRFDSVLICAPLVWMYLAYLR